MLLLSTRSSQRFKYIIRRILKFEHGFLLEVNQCAGQKHIEGEEATNKAYSLLNQFLAEFHEFGWLSVDSWNINCIKPVCSLEICKV